MFPRGGPEARRRPLANRCLFRLSHGAAAAAPLLPAASRRSWARARARQGCEGAWDPVRGTRSGIPSPSRGLIMGRSVFSPSLQPTHAPGERKESRAVPGAVPALPAHRDGRARRGRAAGLCRRRPRSEGALSPLSQL